MVQTSSTMLPLGTIAPNFFLYEPLHDRYLTLEKQKSSIASCVGTVVMFICNHCPYVLHILTKLVEVAAHYTATGIAFLAINANDLVEYPEDSPDNMVLLAKKYHFGFPYLYDVSQVTARAYHAACTPDFFVFDDKDSCVYRGRFDSATPGNNEPITGIDLSRALEALHLGHLLNESEQKPSLGCNIKWKKNQ